MIKKHTTLQAPVPGVPPAFVNKPTAIFVLGSSAFYKRAVFAKMLRIIRRGGRGCATLVDYASLLEVVEFIRNGGILPLLPSERRAAN